MTILTTYQAADTPYKDPECAICFFDYEDKTPVYLLGCRHLIHEPCLLDQVICPFCRVAIAPIQQTKKIEQTWRQYFFSFLPIHCLPRSYRIMSNEEQ